MQPENHKGEQKNERIRCDGWSDNAWLYHVHSGKVYLSQVRVCIMGMLIAYIIAFAIIGVVGVAISHFGKGEGNDSDR